MVAIAPAVFADQERVMTTADLLREHHCKGIPLVDLGRLALMWHTVESRYRGVYRKSGGPATEHFFCVEMTLYELGFGADAEIIGLGHDLIEDGVMTVTEILEVFDSRVTACILALSKRPEHKDDFAGYAAQIMEAVEHGLWESVVAKLADRLHNLRTLDGFEDPQRECGHLVVTRDVIFPLAEACRGYIERFASDKLAAYDELCVMLHEEYRVQCKRLGVAAA